MDYPYENLSPETFQLFCQALLVKDFPGMQCFPVAQPDGGRDAAQYYFDRSSAKEFAMFQVKFVRQPQAEKDPHKWIINIVADEAPKIKKQIPSGAKMYILMTNVSGTAHPEAGSIDLVNATLTKELGIPAVCWWRNDLSRRLDTAWDLKWAYPSLMTGPDLIRLVIEGNLSESKERRTAVIRAFVTNQYNIEQYVKFKQVDLDNRLLDLFIDVPITAGNGPSWRTQAQRYILHNPHFSPDEFWMPSHETALEEEEEDRDRLDYLRRVRNQKPGAASFLLTRSTTDFPLAVLEGAPGQGKSTISQYICQVHRMRLLNKIDDLQQIPDDHRKSAIRLPIKVDLRDFAAWLVRRNPFSAESEELPAGMWEKSLESFLSALIRNQSGGAAFDVSDLHAVIRLSAVLLVLDGLDEVADIKRRTEVVSEISKGAERLKSVAASFQVIVTSRPAAFENSPGLPDHTFRYFSLDSVTQELIEEYASKWVKARRLGDRDSSDVKRILRDKLSQPHMRDLARNPMQLSILLSLIHTRGASLPDRRTALYDSYVELFFNRESEKSNIVRDNRELLIDIHRYLAWILHVEAEHSDEHSGGRPNGAIEESRLKAVLRDYLSSEGRNPELAEMLFTGVIERVVALVSRVQGTYEFEVQPLREYFTARFLHETAPYSPTGNEKSGTRPDRFDAISRNFYWLNVTRFYAGCYSKGELPSLIDRLAELLRDPAFRSLSHPRVLGATLLGDWVFTQHPKSVSEVIRLVLDGLGLRFLLTSNSRRHSRGQPLILPAECGRTELVAKCLAMLRAIPPTDYALDVLDLLRANTTREEILPLWQAETSAASGDARTAWLEYGFHLGCLSTVKLNELAVILSDTHLLPERINPLLNARRSDLLESSAVYLRSATDALLDRKATINPGLRKLSPLEAFGQAIDPARYAVAFQDAPPIPLVDVLKRYSPRGFSLLPDKLDNPVGSPEIAAFNEIISVASKGFQTEARIWATELSPWENIVLTVQKQYGERWAVYHLANVASGIKSATEKCTDAPELFDSSKSICRRSRYARLRAGNPTWWIKELKEAATLNQQMLGCALYFTWASPNTITESLEIADRIIGELPEDAWTVLFDSVEQAVNLTRPQSGDRVMELLESENLASISTHRTSALLRLRAKPTTAHWLYRNLTNNFSDADKRALRVFQLDAIARLLKESENPSKHLEFLTAAYENNVVSLPYSNYEFARYSNQFNQLEIPLKLALIIIENADHYPSFLVAAAEAKCREDTAKHVRPVGDVAVKERWFKNQ